MDETKQLSNAQAIMSEVNAFIKTIDYHKLIELVGAEQVHNYSWCNTIHLCLTAQLINEKGGITFDNERRATRQMPSLEPRRVEGIFNSFENWKKSGYSVELGAKAAFTVLVPAPVKVKRENAEGAEVDGMIMRFKTGLTWDVSQTTAYPDFLKSKAEQERKVYTRTTADLDYADILTKVKALYPELVIEHKTGTDVERGAYVPAAHRIIMGAENAHTLVHEVGHHIEHGIMAVKAEYPVHEILAEMAARTIFKTSYPDAAYNFNYSNIWASRIDKDVSLQQWQKWYTAIGEHVNSKWGQV